MNVWYVMTTNLIVLFDFLLFLRFLLRFLLLFLLLFFLYFRDITILEIFHLRARKKANEKKCKPWTSVFFGSDVATFCVEHSRDISL